MCPRRQSMHSRHHSQQGVGVQDANRLALRMAGIRNERSVYKALHTGYQICILRGARGHGPSS
jgi:hypothetical protein